MNIVFTALTLISIVMLTIASPATAFPTMLQGVMNAITLIFKLAAIYAVWLSVLKMMQATALDKKLSKLPRPLIKRLFKKESDETYGWISINLAANMLGMGGVATPAGIKAMQSMSLDGQTVASPNMILLLIINATSIQLIPATVIAIRATAGSADASSIFLPTLISTAISTISGIILCKVFSLTDSKKDNSFYINGGLSSKKNPLKRLSFKIKSSIHTTNRDVCGNPNNSPTNRGVCGGPHNLPHKQGRLWGPHKRGGDK